MPRKPGTKVANKEQLAMRHAAIREALAQCQSTSDIVATYTKEWGVVWRTIHGYIATVRAETSRVKLAALTPEQRSLEQNMVIEGIKRSISEAWLRVDGKNRPNPDLQRVQKGYELLGNVYGVFTDRLELAGPGGGPIAFAGSPGLTKMLGKLEEEAHRRKAAAAEKAVAP